MKICNKCKIEKDFSDFHKRSNRPCGYKNICKDCVIENRKLKPRTEYMRNYDLMKSYNITVIEYNVMFELQQSKCGICNKSIKDFEKSKKKHLCIDHCHTTGKVRGLLCNNCNRGIGLLGDNPEIINNALIYLLKHKINN